MICPTVKNIANVNKKVLELKKITKAERHEFIKPKEALQKVIDNACLEKNSRRGAAILLNGINRGHFFASANKRTSFISATDYLKSNNEEIPKKSKGETARFLLKVREGRASINDIERWLEP